MVYEVSYQVYRYKQWWKNSYAIDLTWIQDVTKESLTEIAYDFDQWDIRNLTYKII